MRFPLTLEEINYKQAQILNDAGKEIDALREENSTLNLKCEQIEERLAEFGLTLLESGKD
jgi:regulator of replication initiation timing